MTKQRKIYNLRIDTDTINDCKEVVEAKGSVYDSVSQLIRKFINDGLKKLNN